MRASKAEKQHMDKVAQLPCAACGCFGVELHHPRGGTGMGRKASHFDVIPLCAENHRTGGYGVAIHAGKKAFEERFGTEETLLAHTRDLLKISSPIKLSKILPRPSTLEGYRVIT